MDATFSVCWRGEPSLVSQWPSPLSGELLLLLGYLLLLLLLGLVAEKRQQDPQVWQQRGWRCSHLRSPWVAG